MDSHADGDSVAVDLRHYHLGTSPGAGIIEPTNLHYLWHPFPRIKVRYWSAQSSRSPLHSHDIRAGLTTGTYTYNALGQLVIRVVTNAANNGTTVYYYDQDGHVPAEYDGMTAALKREYVWLGDMPLAVIDPGTPNDTTYYVHADHLNRPIAMTDATKAFVAQFTYRAYGEVFAYTGTVGLDLRFPGQLFQAESGLYYNWFRQYDPSTGRYTQPDPLGLVDGPSRYAYVGNDPLQVTDFTGRQSLSDEGTLIFQTLSGDRRMVIYDFGGRCIISYIPQNILPPTYLSIGHSIAQGGLLSNDN